MNYHLSRGGENLGTFSLEELRRRRQTGELTGAEFVWREGMVNWQVLDSVLAGASPGVTPPPLPAVAARRRANRVTVWVIALAIVAFLATTTWVGVTVFKLVKKAGPFASQSERGAEAVEVASHPIIWNTNTLTEADVKKRGRAFRVRQYVEAYRTTAQQDGPCYAEGLKFLGAWLAHNYPDRSGETTNVHSPHALAGEIGARPECDDPVLLTLAAVSSDELHEKVRLLERALAGYEKSRYKAYPKMFATIALGTESTDRPERLRALDSSALQLLQEAFRDGSLTPEDQTELADVFIGGWGDKFFDRNAAAVRRTVDQAKGFAWLARLLEGEDHVNQAWKARGSGYANSVTEKGWQGFSENLGKAREAFTKAWELRPDLPQPSARMITVAMGDSDADEMRQWFDRATAAQIDHAQAWSHLRWGLRPRWHGSQESMLALGIAAVETKRFDTDVPRKFRDVVADLEAELEVARGEHIYGRHDIWPHLEAMYEGYIGEPTEAHRQPGWRSSYATVAYFAGKYDVAREQFEALKWQPLEQSLAGWGRDLSLMPLEVAARTSPAGKEVAKAESKYMRGGIAEATRLYQELQRTAAADERTKKFIEHRLASLDMEQRLAAGEWVDFLPSGTNDPNWVIANGKVRRLEDGALEAESDRDPHLLYSRARVGPDFEVKGEFEVVRSSNQSFQAGLVMGLPDSYSSEWYAFRMKRNQTEGEVGSFSRGWSKTQVYKSVGLNDRQNSFQFRLQDGKADAWLNGSQILRKAAPTKTMHLSDDCLLGLGAYHDANSTVVRYRNVQARRLVPSQRTQNSGRGENVNPR